MVIVIDAEKIFDKCKYPFLVSTLNIQEIEWKFPKLMGNLQKMYI